MLVDIDLIHGLQESVMIAQDNVSFSIEFEYENAPLFCGACHIIGHLTSNCCRFVPEEARNKGKEILEDKKSQPIASGNPTWISKGTLKFAMVLGATKEVLNER